MSLRDAGLSVVHLCPGDDVGRKVIKGIEVRTYRSRRGILGRLLQLRALYRLAAEENAHTYHCNEIDSWVVGVLLSIFRKANCVFDVHEHYPSTFAESRFPRWMQPFVAWTIRMLYRLFTPFTSRIVLAKRSVAEDFYFARNKLVLVQNFTPLKGVRIAPVNRRTKQRGETIRLVHLGLITKIRGWPQLLEAISRVKSHNVVLDVIGEFHDKSQGEFAACAKKLGISDRVTVQGWMPFDQAFQRLCASDIGLVVFQPGIKNHEYALPHKMFDYMAAGNAVLCPDFAVEIAPIVVESGCGLLINPASPEDIAAKIDLLCDQPEKIVEMGERGKRAVIERYNWEAEANKLGAMYLELGSAN